MTLHDQQSVLPLLSNLWSHRRCLAVVCVMSIASLGAAQSISWNKDVLGTIDPEDTAGLSPAEFWNNSFPEDSETNLFDSNGMGTTLDIVPAAPYQYQVLNTLQGADADGSSNKRLLNGYLNAGATATPLASSVAISQIPYASYDVYVYFSSDVAGRTGTVSLGGVSYDFNTLGAPSIAGANALFVEANAGTTAADAANYAVFTGLSDASQTLSVNIPDYGGIAGFQVVNTGAAEPVPFTWGSDQDNQNYSAGPNWAGGASPNPGAAVDVVFGPQIDGDVVVNLDVSPTFNRLNFNNTLGVGEGDGDYFITAVSNQTITLAGDAEVYAAGRHWLRAEVTGTSGLNATGPGELIVDSVNSFNGGLTVDGGSVAIVRNGALPAGNGITLTSGADLGFWGATNAFFTGASGAPGFGSGTLSSNVSLSDGSVLTVNDTADLNISGVVSGSGGLTAGGADAGGLLTLTGANTFSGETRGFLDSVITVSGAGTLGVSDGTVANGTFLSGDAQLALPSKSLGNEFLFLDANNAGEQAKIASSGNSSITGNVYASEFGDADGLFEISSTGGTLTLSGSLVAFDSADSQRTYVFSGDGDFLVNRISDEVVDANGDTLQTSTGDNVGVIKRGAGTLTINTATDLNDDYYFGATNIEGGTLAVASDGSNNGELRSDVAVKAGATFDVSDFGAYNLLPIAPYEVGLSGGGTVVANSIGVFESNTIVPGDSVGTLKVNGNVTLTYFDANSTTVPNTGSLDFELGDNATISATDNAENDLVAVSGTFTLNTTNAPSNQFVLNVSAVDGGFDTANNYTLVRAGAIATQGGAGAANFSVNIVNAGGAPLNTRYTPSVVLTGNEVQLDVGGDAANLTWTGSTNNNWDVGGTSNWTNGSAQQFFDLDHATFNGAAGPTVNVVESVSPSTMTVSAGEYTYIGADINAVSVSVTGATTVASFNNAVGGDVSVSSGATLAGTGTLRDNVTVESGSTLRVGGTGLTGGPIRVISWNVDNNGTVGGDGAGSLPALSQIAGVEEAGGWTNDFPDNDFTDLRDHLGAATTLDIAPFSNSGTWNINNFAHAGQDTDGSWNKELLTGYLNSGSPNGDGGAGVVISEIPFGEYDIIAYFNSDVDTRTGTVSDGTTTYSFKAAGATGSFGGDGNATYFEATATSTDADTANYAVFAGLTGPTQTITVDIPDFGGLAGFQVVRAASALDGETLSVLGDVSLESGSTVSFNIGASGVNDRLDIEGGLTFADGSVLEVLLDGAVSASSLDEGDSWDLLDFATASGLFDVADFVLPSLGSGLVWDTSSLLVDGVLSISATLSLPGDANGDGSVDILDLDILSGNFGTMGGATVATGDFNGDGNVDILDLDILSGNFGSMASAAAAVPEPHSLVIFLAVGGAFSLRVATRRSGHRVL